MAERMKSPERKKLFKTGDVGKIVEAITSSAITLEDIPDEVKTEEMCIAACEKRWMAFVYVPKHLRTEKVISAMLENSGEGLQYIPEEQRTKELCLLALRKDNYDSALYNTPEKYWLDDDFCFSAISQGVNIMKQLPEERKTKEMCLANVKTDGWALRKIPDEHKTFEICLTACKTSPDYHSTAFVHDVPADMKAKVDAEMKKNKA